MTNTTSQWLASHPIAHRGLHDERTPENSLGAFRAAAASGYAIELDVHCTSDNQIVVYHDDDTERLTGIKFKVTRTPASELQQLQLLKTEFTIPLLSDVFEAVQSTVPILIEVKAGTRAARICPLIVRLIEAYEGNIAIQSFDPFVISWFHKHAPNVPTGQLSCRFKGKRMLHIQKLMLTNMVFNTRNRPDFIAFDVADMPSKAVQYWQKHYDIPLLLWTVKSDDDRQLAQKYKANIIFEHVREKSTL